MGSVSPRLSVLLLADDDRLHANTVLEHIEALTRLSRHDVVVYNPRALKTSFALDLDEFDVVVIHYSLISIADPYLAPPFREKLRRFDGLKVQIIQDDYRWVNDFRAMIRELGITVLFTLVPERAIEQVWPASELPGVERITTLAGYVPLHAGSHRIAEPTRSSLRHRLSRSRPAVLGGPPRAGEGLDRSGRQDLRSPIWPSLRHRLA